MNIYAKTYEINLATNGIAIVAPLVFGFATLATANPPIDQGVKGLTIELMQFSAVATDVATGAAINSNMWSIKYYVGVGAVALTAIPNKVLAAPIAISDQDCAVVALGGETVYLPLNLELDMTTKCFPSVVASVLLSSIPVNNVNVSWNVNVWGSYTT